MNRIKFSLPVIVIACLFVACGKDDDGTPADTAATITYNAPLANARYANTSTLQVRGNIDDADILKNAKLEIKNKATGAVLYSQTSATGNLSVYSFNWSWPVTGITSMFTATVKVTSTDQYNYTTSKEVDIILEP